MKRSDIVLISPAIVVFVLASTISYVAGYAKDLDLTRYLTRIDARFAIIMLMVLAPLPIIPKLLSRLSKAAKIRKFCQLEGSHIGSYGQLNRSAAFFFRPLEGIGLSLIFTEETLQFVGFLGGTSYSHLLVRLILFGLGNFLVSFLLSTIWVFDDLGIKICHKKSGEVRRLSTLLGVSFPMPLIAGGAGIAVLFQHNAVVDALADLIRITTVLYPPYAIFAFVHHEFFRRRSTVLQRLFTRDQ